MATRGSITYVSPVVSDLSQQIQDLNKRLTLESNNLNERLSVETNERRALHAEVQDLRGQLHASQVFEGGKFLFTCDILENLVVKMTYSLQKAVAGDLLASRLQPESFWAFFREKNLAHLCYGRVLKRLLFLRSVRARDYIEELLVERNMQRSEERPRAQHPGTQQADKLLEYLLDLAEEEVAEELDVEVIDLKITAATYLLQVKPERNTDTHRNQLHPPAHWRYSSVDSSPAPPELIDRCLAAPPLSEPREAPRDDIRNLEMVDIVLASFQKILADHIRRMSEEVVITIIHRVRERICENLADTLKRYLQVSGGVPESIVPGLESSVYQCGKRWMLWPKGKPEHKLVLTRDGEWHDLEGNRLARPFFGWPLADLLL